MGTRLYVGNLAYTTTNESLRAAFEAEGRKVKDVYVAIDRMTNRSRGFGFVEMLTDDDAQKAVVALDNKMVDGRAIRVNEARERGAEGPPPPSGPPRSDRPPSSGPPRGDRPPPREGGGFSSGPPRGPGGFSSGPPRSSPGGFSGGPPRPAGGGGGGFRGGGFTPPPSPFDPPAEAGRSRADKFKNPKLKKDDDLDNDDF